MDRNYNTELEEIKDSIICDIKNRLSAVGGEIDFMNSADGGEHIPAPNEWGDEIWISLYLQKLYLNPDGTISAECDTDTVTDIQQLLTDTVFSILCKIREWEANKRAKRKP